MQTQLQEAYNALLAKEYDKAFVLYSALAEQKEPTSFYYLRQSAFPRSKISQYLGQ